MELDLIVGGVAGVAAAYMHVEEKRSIHIDNITCGIIADSCYRRSYDQPLRLPEKVPFIVTGYASSRAIKRYEKFYTTLQGMEKADAREVQNLHGLFHLDYLSDER